MFYIFKEALLVWKSSNPMEMEWADTIEKNFTKEELEKLENWCIYIDGSINETQAYLDIKANKYKELRRAEYPDWRTFADAYVKWDDIAMQEYKDACLAVKLKFPKP